MTDILFFPSPNGMGHVTRNFALSEHLKNYSIKFITGGGAAEYLKDVGAEVIEIMDSPKFLIQNGGMTKPGRWLWDYYKYYKSCKKISKQIIEQENPKLVISDEDYASLDISQTQKIPTVLITNILEIHFAKGIASLLEKKMNQAMQDIRKKCDVVIMPEKGKDEDNIKRVGPIVRKTKFSRDELREKFSFDKKTIVISVGGTGAGDFLIQKTLETYSKFKELADFVIVPGPSIKKDFGKKIRNLGYVNNLHEVIYASDIIISLAGSSTIAESKFYGTPGIFIPIENHFEQEYNARNEGFSFEDVTRLDSLILKKLDEPRNPQMIDGTERAAEIIKKLL